IHINLIGFLVMFDLIMILLYNRFNYPIGGNEMANYIQVGKIQVAKQLYDFVNQEALKDAELEQAKFWNDFEQIVSDFTPENEKLLKVRQDIQDKIDNWHAANKEFDAKIYKEFLKEIGYLEEEVYDFKIDVENVDDEIAKIGGPQLVVPINNPRYAINAANARWSSLYDALYGSDVISEDNGQEKGSTYNEKRGAIVIQKGRELLDESVPLEKGSHESATLYYVAKGELKIELESGETVGLKDPNQFKGYQGREETPASILLENNGLHIDIQIDPSNVIGKTDLAGIQDIVMESAITSIMDCEDSVTAVDADDKVDVYKNWLGLIRGELTVQVNKGVRTIERKFNEDRIYTSPTNGEVRLPGRVLMLVRNVGHLLRNDAVLNEDGSDSYEGILDAVFTSLMAKHNLLGKGKHINSKKGSIYIVKPKMHGSKEVKFTNELFARVEDMLDLERNTIKVGVMDEERRTSLNLKNCINEVKERAIFINTGFLDRTGDEIHTAMKMGPMLRKDDMKNAKWLGSYEKNNVQTGLATGFQGNAQIGKGMWAMPDKMADMVEQKIGHVKAGANTAWVPSPTAGTLHALHYHEIDYKEVQDKIIENGLEIDYQADILEIPIESDPSWTEEEIQ